MSAYLDCAELRCSSKNARTCSGSSVARNSTPTGSGSGQCTVSGVGILVGFASMISLLNDYNNCANLADAAFAPPHAAEIPNTVLSIDALSDRESFGLNLFARFDVQRMIVRVADRSISVIACRYLLSCCKKYSFYGSRESRTQHGSARSTPVAYLNCSFSSMDITIPGNQR